MNDEFENRLRRALRPVEAPAGFAERLLQRLPERTSPVLVALPPRAVPSRRNFTVPAAMAASLLAAVMLGQHLANNRMDREEAAGLAASQELMEAMRVTSQKLDMAYQAVNNPPPSAVDEEENPS